jgi:4-amino-4-deoxy-L-arabinose transferase-like glycosyltransferase
MSFLKIDMQMIRPGVIWIISAVLLLFIFLLGLDRSYLFDVDEGAFTEATREMLVSRDWLHTTLNGVDRFDKPIGVYWLQAISASIFGQNEFAFRLPSALSAWTASLALSYFAKEKWGTNAAILMALISSTSLGPWAMARTATADALLGLFFVLTFLDLWRSIDTQKLFYSRRLSIWVACGMLVKGPVAVVVPVGTLVFYFLFVQSARPHIQKMILDRWSWVLLFGIAMPWYLYAYFRHGQLFLDGFLLKHNVERFTGSLEGHSGAWFYFLLALPILWMPWTIFSLNAVLNFKNQWAHPFLKFSWIWFGFVLFFFSLANTKLPHYLLYAGPAVCMLLTYTSLHASRLTWSLNCIFGLLGVSILLFIPTYVQNHSELINNIFYKQLIINSEINQMWHWVFVTPFVFCFLWVLNFFLEKFNAFHFQGIPQIGVLTVAVFQCCILSLLVLPWWSQTIQSPVYVLAIQLKDRPENIVQWRVHFPSFATYSNREVPKREPLPGELAIVKNLQPYWPSDWEVVASSGPISVVKSPGLSRFQP